MAREEIQKKSDSFIAIIIIQSICVVSVIACVFFFKFFVKNEYAKIRNWYFSEIACDTDVDEVLK